jgi:hypothetical protein
MESLISHNKPIDIILQIYNIIKNKSEYDDAQKKIEKFLNSIAYWSPELVEIRFWKYIYKICIHFFNEDNEDCRKIFNIYTENIIRYKHYNSFYEWNQSQINLEKAIERTNIIRAELQEITMHPDRDKLWYYDNKTAFYKSKKMSNAV